MHTAVYIFGWTVLLICALLGGALLLAAGYFELWEDRLLPRWAQRWEKARRECDRCNVKKPCKYFCTDCIEYLQRKTGVRW